MLAHLLAPERMAEVIPRARLILLMRDPIDRAYSLYHHWVRNGGESLTFEEVIEAEKTRLLKTPRRGIATTLTMCPLGTYPEASTWIISSVGGGSSTRSRCSC